MKMIPEELKEIEKKDWHLWILLSCLFVILTGFIVLIVFYSDVSRFFQERLDIYSFNFLFLGYIGLSFLFMSYIIFQGLAVRRLRRNIIEEKINLSITIEKRYQELEALFEVSTLVNSEVKPNRIFQLIAKHMLTCLNGDRSSLMILNSKNNKLYCVAAYGYKADLLKNAEEKVGKGVCGWVVENDQPLLLDQDKIHQYNFVDLVKKEGTIFSALCVPLKVKGKPKGVLNVNSFQEDKKFTQDDLKLLSIFAENAALSIERAELNQKYEKQANALKKTVDELMSAQSQLIDSQKMRALGDLARGMAHDFNNILAIVAGRAELSLNWTQEVKVSKSLLQILNAVSEGQKTVHRIQEFYHTRSKGSWVKMDINHLVQEVVEVTRPRWEDEARTKGIKIKVEMGLSEVKSVLGNPPEVFDALTNIMLNAVEAMPQGGKIILKTESNDDSVVITVRDTGVSMTDEVRSRLFDPFFTTKTTRNAGLGLSVVYGVISRHKGRIEVESKEGLGTTFIIKLPASKEPKKEKLKEEQLGIPNSRPANILLIDDNKELRDIVTEMLTAKGNKVAQVEDGVQALDVFEKDKFDLVFVNLSLPELSGWEVIQRIKQKDSDVKVALLTGWGAQIDFEEAKKKGIDFLISKPFKTEELLTVLGQALREKELA
jgi:signal transduction histidine kinase/ActR/RegA family two-component response regulator